MAVVGLGAIGSLTLWSLARRGVQVTGFERGEPGHDDAAYGGYTRQFRLGTHDCHHQHHLPLARRSLELWRELERTTGELLYVQTGQLGIGPSHDPDICRLLTNLEQTELPHRVMTATETMREFPAHRLAAEEVGVLVQDAGVLRSNRAVAAAVRAGVGHGAELVAPAPVTSIEAGPHGEITITSGGRDWSFDHVVVTTGPWIGELVPALRARIAARTIVSGWHTAASPELVAPDRFPPGFRRSAIADLGFTFLPSLDGRGVKMVHWMPLRPEVAETTTWDRAIDPALVRGVEPAVEAALTGVAPTPTEVQVYLEGFTPERFPLISRPAEGLTVLCGFSGMGFAVAPAFGEIATDLALGATPSFDLAASDNGYAASAQ